MASLTPISGTLGRKRAAHLLRRATFGCDRETIDIFAQMTFTQAVSSLLTFPSLPSIPVAGSLGSSNNTANAFHPDGRIKAGTGETNKWWFYQNIDPNQASTAFYRLSFFIHTCSTVGHDGMGTSYWYYHLYLIMKYTNQSYKDLVRKMCTDHAMGNYLTIGDNTNAHPNENFARELLELFTLGKGPQIGPGNYTNYTEDDIRSAARVLTGWRYYAIYTDTSKFDPDLGWIVMWPYTQYHDASDKAFSPAFQNKKIIGRSDKVGMAEEVDELIELIFSQEAVSLFIMRKLYRFYVHYDITPEIENDIIKPLAEAFRQNDFQFAPVLEMLFQSKHFYDEDDNISGDEIIGGQIKSPLELFINTINFFKVMVPDPAIDLKAYYDWMEKMERYQDKMGFQIFNPTSVAGYEPMYQEPDYNRYWINPSLLPNRYDHIYSRLVDHDNQAMQPEGTFNILDYIEDPANVSVYTGPDPMGNAGPHEGARIADHLVHEIVDYLLPVELSTDRLMYFRDELLLDNLSAINWMFEWDNYKSTGDATNIYPQLAKLIRGILQSPEFQLC
ncbi:MAG: DUF1800 family protein [Bacteroidia bacterium]